MLKLTKKVEYGLIALMHMDGMRNGDLAVAREISDAYNVPPELLGKVLQSLAKAGLVQSVQGAKGGYRLLRPIGSVKLGEVVEAVEGPVSVTPCQVDPASCEQFPSCNIREPVTRVQKQLVDYMYGLPLEAFRKSVTPGQPVTIDIK